MVQIQNNDTRYFIEINLSNLKIIRCGFAQKIDLDKGHQNNPEVHRLFLTLGQYNKFVSRCESELKSVLDT